MPEFLVLCWMLIPQFVAGIFAKSMGRSFWFWFFISFLIPIVSLILLLFLDKDKDEKRHSYKLADHVVTPTNELKTKAESKDPDNLE
jgi:hypothetical protein